MLRGARLGNEFFRHFDIRQATAVTYGGQLVIQYAEQEINKVLNTLLNTTGVDYVLASDTDSLYVKAEAVVQKLLAVNPNLTTDQLVTKLDAFTEQKLVPAFTKIFAALGRMLGAREDAMVMKREAIADRAIWTAKKHYILHVYDNEGIRYSTPKLKMMGIEAVKSSTPAACREAIKEVIQLVMAKDQAAVQQYVAAFRERFATLPFEAIAFPRSVQGLTAYAHRMKGIPIHVAGALAYNRLLEEHHLTAKYERIQEGEKIKFCYLVHPNPIAGHVVAAITVLPPEFGLTPYLDYATMFEKAFLEPLRPILEAVGWYAEKPQTLEEFFT